MISAQQTLIRGALAAVHSTGAHRALAPLTRGCGAILMLHSVSPAPRPAFDPNAGLCVTPEYLERAIRIVRKEGYDIVSLDELQRRLMAGATSRRFVAFTLDDGYRDNLQFAVPVFRRAHVPYCIYVPTRFADGKADLWWYGLQGAIDAGRDLRATLDGHPRTFACGTLRERQRSWRQLYRWLRRIDEAGARETVASLCAQAGFDADALASTLMMSWDEVRELATDPMCTIGGHTLNHYSLAKLGAKQCRQEIAGCKAELERQIGKPVRHFSFPYGTRSDAGPREFALAAEAGYATAVTTRKGLLFPKHRGELTALPRLSLNGELQDERLLSVLLGGAPFAVMNTLRKLAPA